MRQSIPPLIACKWGQYSPYYNKLKYGGKYQLVGCTALAVTQIAYYWMVQRGYHRGCKATPNYVTTSNKFEVKALPPLTVFDWKNLKAKPKTTAEKNAVAILCEYVAKALRSDFLNGVTSAKRTAVEGVLNTSLRMGSAKHVYLATVGKAKFDEMIYDDLAHGRPAVGKPDVQVADHTLRVLLERRLTGAALPDTVHLDRATLRKTRRVPEVILNNVPVAVLAQYCRSVGYKL